MRKTKTISQKTQVEPAREGGVCGGTVGSLPHLSEAEFPPQRPAQAGTSQRLVFGLFYRKFPVPGGEFVKFLTLYRALDFLYHGNKQGSLFFRGGPAEDQKVCHGGRGQIAPVCHASVRKRGVCFYERR